MGILLPGRRLLLKCTQWAGGAFSGQDANDASRGSTPPGGGRSSPPAGRTGRRRETRRYNLANRAVFRELAPFRLAECFVDEAVGDAYLGFADGGLYSVSEYPGTVVDARSPRTMPTRRRSICTVAGRAATGPGVCFWRRQHRPAAGRGCRDDGRMASTSDDDCPPASQALRREAGRSLLKPTAISTRAHAPAAEHNWSPMARFAHHLSLCPAFANADAAAQDDFIAWSRTMRVIVLAGAHGKNWADRILRLAKSPPSPPATPGHLAGAAGGMATAVPAAQRQARPALHPIEAAISAAMRVSLDWRRLLADTVVAGETGPPRRRPPPPMKLD